jgi:hypothetical protein
LPNQCNPKRKRSKGEEVDKKMQEEEEEKLVFYLQFLKFIFENACVHVS